MRRREFITLAGGVAAWPAVARAQRPSTTRRIGVLMNIAEDDVMSPIRIMAFRQTLEQLGWVEGLNVLTEIRWAGGKADLFSRYAAELAALAPDVILAVGSPSIAALKQATPVTPIIFALVTDPVGAGYVANLARPGGNITGFSCIEYGLSGKLLGLLREIAPDLKRVAVLRDSSIASGMGQFGAVQAVAPSMGLEAIPIDVSNPKEIERAITAFASQPHGALFVTAGTSTLVNRDLIIELASRNRLPAIYSDANFVVGGGLMFYGPDPIDSIRRAAGYVDRILKGTKPSELPVQSPTKYRMAINLKTAKSLGLRVPDKLLAIADEVVE